MNKHSFGTSLFSLASLVFAMASFQIGASFATKLFPAIGPFAATALRQSFSAIFLLIFARIWRVDFHHVNFVAVIFYGIAMGLMNLSFYLAIERIPLGITVAIEFSGPLFIGLISSRKLSDYILLLMVMLGLYLLLPISKFSQNLDLLGVFYALLAAVGWAAYIFFGDKLGASSSGITGVAVGMAVSSFFTLPMGVMYATGEIFTPEILLWGIGLAILSSALPYSLEMLALKRMGKQTFSLLMSLEPAFAAIAGAFLLSQILGLPQIIGISLVVVAALLASFTHSKKPPIEELAN